MSDEAEVASDIGSDIASEIGSEIASERSSGDLSRVPVNIRFAGSRPFFNPDVRVGCNVLNSDRKTVIWRESRILDVRVPQGFVQ